MLYGVDVFEQSSWLEIKPKPITLQPYLQNQLDRGEGICNSDSTSGEYTIGLYRRTGRKKGCAPIGSPPHRLNRDPPESKCNGISAFNHRRIGSDAGQGDLAKPKCYSICNRA